MKNISLIGQSPLFSRLNTLTGDDGTYSLRLDTPHPLGTALALAGALPKECRTVTYRFQPDDVLVATYECFVTDDQVPHIHAALDVYDATERLNDED